MGIAPKCEKQTWMTRYQTDHRANIVIKSREAISKCYQDMETIPKYVHPQTPRRHAAEASKQNKSQEEKQSKTTPNGFNTP